MTNPKQEKESEGVVAGWLNSRMPWWARVIVVAVFYLGVPTAILAVFLGMATGYIPSPITATHAIVHDTQEKLKNFQEHSARTDQSTLKLLVAICRNTAAKDLQRSTCDRLAEDTITTAP